MKPPADPEAARKALIAVLQNAYSGEYAASLAYDGHAKSVSDPEEKREIRLILDQELEHREFVGKMLAGLGSGPDPRKERVMALVGATISALCRLGGWFIPMYGAGKLEAGNIVEYEIAASLAAAAGRPELVECLLHMAEVEWDHELYFRLKAGQSIWSRVLPIWPAPPPRAEIRRATSSGEAA
jgi:rubrerythrin